MAAIGHWQGAASGRRAAPGPPPPPPGPTPPPCAERPAARLPGTPWNASGDAPQNQPLHTECPSLVFCRRRPARAWLPAAWRRVRERDRPSPPHRAPRAGSPAAPPASEPAAGRRAARPLSPGRGAGPAWSARAHPNLAAPRSRHACPNPLMPHPPPQAPSSGSTTARASASSPPTTRRSPTVSGPRCAPRGTRAGGVAGSRRQTGGLAPPAPAPTSSAVRHGAPTSPAHPSPPPLAPTPLPSPPPQCSCTRRPSSATASAS